MNGCFVRLKLLALLSLFLIGCTSGIRSIPEDLLEVNRRNFGSILGGPKVIARGQDQQNRSTSTALVKINKFLWEGAIETIGFMPILTANPERGKIVTDWYISPDQPDIKVRMMVTISGTELRADAVKVYVERQKKSPKKVWQDYKLPKEDCTKLEILIVERARKIRKLILNNADHS
jgi:hypothetical protein